MALIFGFFISSCKTNDDDDGGSGTNGNSASFEGTRDAIDGRVIIFTGISFVYKVNGTTKYSGPFSTLGSTMTFTESTLGQASGSFQLSGGTLTLSNHTGDSSVDGYIHETQYRNRRCRLHLDKIER